MEGPTPRSDAEVVLTAITVHERLDRPADRQGAADAAVRTYRPDIDGLRAVAVLAVIGFHAFPGVVPGGYIGVDVFFVISGYLITGIIAGERARGAFSLRRFYARRIRRIFPSLCIVLASSLAIGYVVLEPHALAQLGRHVLSGAAFVPNFAFWSEFGYFDTSASAKPLLHLWSLGIEEQFYIVWPLTLLLLHRLRLSTTLVIGALGALMVASFVAGVIVLDSDPTAAFYSPFTRGWELLIGALLAIAARRERPLLQGRGTVAASLIGAGAILAGVLVLTARSAFPGWAALLPTVGAALVIAAGPEAPINRLLAWRPLVGIGLISYPLYLWHWPLLVFIAIESDGAPSALARVATVSVASALALVTYRWLERPIRRRQRRWHIPALAGVLAIVATAGAITDSRGGFAGRYSKSLQEVLAYDSYDAADDGRRALCWMNYDLPFEDFDPECHAGMDGGVLVWGDSHAGRLYPGVRDVVGRRSDVAEIVMSSCPPIVGYRWEGLGPKEFCTTTNARIVDEMRDTTPATVVMFAVWGNYTSDWGPGTEVAAGLAATIAEVVATGPEKIVVIGPAPKWTNGLPTTIHANWDAPSSPKEIAERLESGLDPVPASIEDDLRRIVEGAGGTFVSLLDLLCTDDGCLTSVPGSPGLLLTWDYGHLTTEGAVVVAQYLADEGLIP